VIHLQIFFSVSQRKENHPGEVYESFIQLGEGLFGRTYDAEAMERSALKWGKSFVQRDWTCEPKDRVRSKKTKELRVGVECKRGASQNELGLMQSLMEVRTEVKQHLHLVELTGRRHFRDHSSRWSRAFWTVWAAFSRSGEEDQMARSSA